MTYDERREIDVWLDIVKRNCERTLRSIDLMQDAIGELNRSNVDSENSDEKPAIEGQPNTLKQTDISLEE